jgi:peptidoglycan/xylan/chitin deacetylase (PgdA/CDA1 family)
VGRKNQLEMFKKFALGLSLLALSLIPLLSLTTRAAGPNLISNPSVETASGNLPTDWTNSKTGTNTTAFNYLNTGRTGSRSLQINMTQRSSGQARWVFTPIAVTPSTNYTYTDWYKSNVQTRLAVIIKNKSGTSSTLTTVNAAASATNWKQSSLTFKTPSNAASVTVYHYLNRVGQLTIDDFGLQGPTPVIPTVALTSPASGATVSGTAVPLTATATNTVGVQFKVDGVNVGAEDTSLPYSVNWNSKNVTNGNHTITATARSSTSHTTTATTSVNVNNATAPTVSVTAPTNGSTVSGNSQAVSANANDAVGVLGVQFKLDNVNLGAEDTTAPYGVNWDTTATTDGNHTLTAVARNGAGLTASSSVTVSVLNIVTPPGTPTNIIPNPSAETANGSVPANWSSGSWGTNSPIYTYENTGHTGSRSIKTQITSYSSGDAKWFFNPVNVEAGKTYDYSHWYQSNVTTDVVAQFTDANGTDTYKWLNTVAPSAAWSQFTSSFTVPAGTVKVTVLHVLYSVGWVQMDDVSLALNVPSAPGTIPNSSLEQSTNNLPSSWQKGSWGTNTAAFEYMNEGHTGNHSAKVTVSNYTDGDAKWYFDPINTLERGKQYRFNAWFKGNAIPHPVAMYVKDNGSEQYFGMPAPLANSPTQWQLYSETFTVPIDATSVSVFFYVAENGWIQTDDYSIVPYQAQGFNRPLVTLTFDDGHEENNVNALPTMESYGFDSTQCYATTFIENADNVAAAQASVMQFKNAGHEICSHTVTHPFMTQLTPTQLTYELTHSKEYLQSLTGSPIDNFASPYGDYNATVNTEIMKYYRSHRTVNEGYNSKDNFDIYQLRVQNMLSTTTIAEFQSWLNQAAATNTWLILVYHRVANDPTTYETYISDFQQQMAALSASGLTVKTYNDALNEVVPQL